jgi:hypothetical protein
MNIKVRIYMRIGKKEMKRMKSKKKKTGLWRWGREISLDENPSSMWNECHRTSFHIHQRESNEKWGMEGETEANGMRGGCSLTWTHAVSRRIPEDY